MWWLVTINKLHKFYKIMNILKKFWQSIATRFIPQPLAVSLRKQYKLIPMRELSESEKYVVKKLVDWDFYLNEKPYDWHNESLASILSDFTLQHKSKYDIDFKNKKIDINVSAKTTTGLLTVLNKYRRDFITIVYFIDYLYSERLIYVTPLNENANSIPTSKSWLEENFNYQTSGLTINDIPLLETVEKYYDKALIPTEYLIKYYKQEFKTDEETRFNKNIDKVNESIDVARKSVHVAWIAIGLSFLIGVGGILYDVFKPDSKFDKFIERFDKFEQRIELRLNSIDSRLERIEENDKRQDLRLDKLEEQIKTNR